MEELTIERKTMEMIKYAYQALAQFPKSEKYALCADIKRCMDQILELIIAAKKKYFKKSTLQDLDIEVDKLRKYIRLSNELKFLAPHKYDVWSEKVDEIGRMVGGWIENVKK